MGFFQPKVFGGWSQLLVVFAKKSQSSCVLSNLSIGAMWRWRKKRRMVSVVVIVALYLIFFSYYNQHAQGRMTGNTPVHEEGSLLIPFHNFSVSNKPKG